MGQKKPSGREQFILNIDSNIAIKLKEKANNKGIPLNTYINILLNDIIQQYQ